MIMAFSGGVFMVMVVTSRRSVISVLTIPENGQPVSLLLGQLKSKHSCSQESDNLSQAGNNLGYHFAGAGKPIMSAKGVVSSLTTSVFTISKQT